MAALVPTTDRQIVFLHDLDDGSFTQDGDIVHTLKTTVVDNGNGTATITNADGTPVMVATGSAATADTNTIPTTTTFDAATGMLTQSFTDVDGTALPDIVTDINDPSTLVVDVENRSYVHTSSTDVATTIPVATSLPCVVVTPTGLVDDKWVNDFQDRSIVSNSVNIVDATTPCTRSAISASGANVSAPFSIASGRNSTISGDSTFTTGIDNTVAASYASVSGRGNTYSGNQSGVTGQLNTGSGINSTIAGIRNDNTGNANVVVGDENTVTASNSSITGNVNVAAGSSLIVGGLENDVDAARAIVSGGQNTVTANNGVTVGVQNTASGENNLLGGASNTVSATSSAVTGTNNDVEGSYHTVSGSGHTVKGANNLVNGSANIMDGERNFITGQHNEIPVGVIGANIFGRAVQNPNDHTTVWGWNSDIVNPPASDHRRVEINHITGNINISGALTAGFVFAGFGEKAMPSDGNIAEGVLVVFEGKHKVRIAEEGELADGVTTKTLAMSAGGGVDPDNAPYLLDAYGNRVMEEGKDGITLPVPNPDYDAKKAAELEIECVEMLGRQWAANPNKLKVGDRMVGGAVKGDGGFRVLAVEGDQALLLVK